MARLKQLGIRFSAAEYLRIVQAADAASLTPTAWVRHHSLVAAQPGVQPATTFRPPPRQAPPARLARTAGTRFTDDQFEALADHARACGLTPTAFIRQVVLGYAPTARRPLAHAAIVAVNRIGTNLNQLVHLANSGVLLTPELQRTIAATLAEIQSLRAALLHAEIGTDRAPSP